MTTDTIVAILGIPGAIIGTVQVMRLTGHGLGRMATRAIDARLTPKLAGIEESITRAVSAGMSGRYVEKADFDAHVKHVDQKLREMPTMVRREIHQALAANGGD